MGAYKNITRVKLPLDLVWKHWTDRGLVIQWSSNFERFKKLEIDLDFEEGGFFWVSCIQEDPKQSFQLSGHFERIIDQKLISYVLDNGREISLLFSEKDGISTIKEVIQLKNLNTSDLQKESWIVFIEKFKSHLKKLNENED